MNFESNNPQEETTKPSLLDEIQDFIIELWDLIKQDFRNSIVFISSNRSFFTTAALLAILLQVSSISNLGASFEKYCGSKTSRGEVQDGGGGAEPQVFSYQEYKQGKAQEKSERKAKAKKAKREAALKETIDKKASAKAKKMMAANQKKGVAFSEEHYDAKAKQQIIDKAKAKENEAAKSQSKAASIVDYKAGVDEAREQDQLMKANKERISFFEGIKKKFQSTMSPGALGGPLFGRLDLIFDSVKNIFYIIAIILTIVGVLSLPVLVFLIITYYVFKTMLSKFIIL